ncbi:unnamed protein product [Paramecium sonneborni]|uniref:Uncharacterized protein n=1 Tax=Paramecium sonneborni TaxID=65129 RepID=A0A8S1RUE6_9CILI|nr:unnamed protein product [Paramecium sonneborni]
MLWVLKLIGDILLRLKLMHSLQIQFEIQRLLMKIQQQMIFQDNSQ